MQAKYGEKEIIVFLQKLRLFNKEIGSYSGFVLNEQFRYVVKLSNGRIIIDPKDLILDEAENLSPEEIKTIATGFLSDDPGSLNSANRLLTVQRKRRGARIKRVLSIGVMLIIIVMGGLAMITKEGPANSKPNQKNQGKEIAKTTSFAEKDKTAEVKTEAKKSKTSDENEKLKPSEYLSAAGTYKGNLWGSKLKLDCIVKNKAVSTTYKDAVLKVTYLDKNQQTIATKEYTLNESFSPKSSKTIQLKIDRFKKTESVELEIVDADSK
ncbi:hypothetical protein [Pollutibacter soli]|uniref:hypothetical protein n=1 Tax=Pollutibacter soli TaxID=3034157 RepID=UPI0030134DEC